MLNKRRGPRLTPKDLKRFGHSFLRDLEALLPGRRCRLISMAGQTLDSLDAKEGGLLLPVTFQGRELSHLMVEPAQGYQPSAEIDKMLPEMVSQGLNSLWLRKALLTDRETGLYSREYLNGRLMRAIKKRGRQCAAKNLSMAGETAPELVLVIVEARHGDAVNDLAFMGDLISGHLRPRCLSRFGEHEIAFILEGRPEDLRAGLESSLEAFAESAQDSRTTAAWASYPFEPNDEIEALCEDGLRWFQAVAEILTERASTALFYARQSKGQTAVVSFDDLVRTHGQVVQVLPLDRVVINLGRSTGAASGQVFLASSSEARPGAGTEYKGEVTIMETAENYSVGHITTLNPSRRIVAGDRLTFSRSDARLADGESTRRTLSGFMADLPSWVDFLAQLDTMEQKPVALALVRLDGYEKTLSVLGREECDRLLNFLFERVAKGFPETSVKSLYQPSTLALAWSGETPEAIKPAAHRLVTELKESGPVSIGLAFAPEGTGSSESFVEDARKALNEAAFSGHGQLAVFGPLSLNISGDRLFEGGDFSGAIKEYERGLTLAPNHMNLLNSLGVCHGRLGNSAEALNIFEKIAEIEPDNMMAHYNVGYTHLLSGRMEEAEKSLIRSAELAPDNFEALFLLGKIALETGHLDKALPALKKASELEKTRPAVFRLLGEAMMLAHDNQGALAAFKKAVKAVPNDAYALSALGALFVELANDLEVARSLFLKSVEIDPTNSLYRQRLGRLLFTLGDYSGAEHHLKVAIEYGSRAPELHYQLGCVAEENGRSEDALAHFKAALQQDPAYRPALEKLGEDNAE